MTMVERIAAAIAASRTGSVASWRDHCDEAQQVIDACATLLEPGPVQPLTSISASSATTPSPRG
ncbi:hypothetical protein OF829_15350 [Sphingomonas sp. LB-2]|uniref:hypothetical protein n=1 Tax=Sphingomonas caeni TaxID=2984949 RepID=UPI00222E491B|nr:hypothetical protein [Sphingomonas caeni]MCW3848611.1 hypothetical protein [Sphingomonas caeni]